MKKAMTLAIVAILAFCVLTACSAESRIVGKWTASTTILGVTTELEYEFLDDGTGTRGVGPAAVPFTWHFADDKLVISTNVLITDISESYTFEFTFDGKTCTLVKDGNVTTLTKIVE